MPTLQQLVIENNLGSKVSFYGRLPFEQMMQITAACDVGVTLDRSTNINYMYSLPNKLFDYIQCGLAIVSSNLYEINHIINTYQCGIVIDEVTPEHIADAIKKLQQNPEILKSFKENSFKAARLLHWENEEKHLKSLYADLFSK
jgi:glycosyltransferase involved in cell wall biosynthesis